MHQTGNGRIRVIVTSLKRKKKVWPGSKRKKTRSPARDPENSTGDRAKLLFQMGPDGLFSAGRFISYEGVNYRNGRQKGKGPPVPNDREKMLPPTRRDER